MYMYIVFCKFVFEKKFFSKNFVQKIWKKYAKLFKKTKNATYVCFLDCVSWLGGSPGKKTSKNVFHRLSVFWMLSNWFSGGHINNTFFSEFNFWFLHKIWTITPTRPFLINISKMKFAKTGNFTEFEKF